jgi:ribokinase
MEMGGNRARGNRRNLRLIKAEVRMERELKITVLGSINHDIVTKANRLPREGETVDGSGVEWIPGGKGANQALQSALLGMETWFIGCAGADESGAVLESSLSGRGVRTDYLSRLPDVQSGMCSIYVDPQGRNMLVHSPGANMMISSDHLDSASGLILESDYFIVQNEINMDAIEYGLKLARDGKAKTVLNPAPAIPLSEEIFPMVDYITPNETECEAYTGIAPDGKSLKGWCRECAEWFLRKGAGGVCITLGKDGAYYFDGETEVLSRAFPVNVVDTTAAGDCFNAGFAVGLAKGYATSDALRFANACGAICAGRMGAQPSIGTLDEVLQLIDN